MEPMTKAERHRRLLGWRPWSPVRGNVFCLMNHGFQGSFTELVDLVGSDKQRIAKVLNELFDAGLVDFIPFGTPTDAIDCSEVAEDERQGKLKLGLTLVAGV